MNAKNKIILVLMLLSGTDALGQFQASFEISGSINSFQADSQNDNIPGADISKTGIHSYNLELRGGYSFKETLEVGLGLSFNHYSDAYNNAYKNFEDDNVVWLAYLSYHFYLNDFKLSPGFSAGFGNYKASSGLFSDGNLTRYTPEVTLGYLPNSKISPYLNLRYQYKRIDRTDFSTGSIADQLYKQNYLQLFLGLKYSFK